MVRKVKAYKNTLILLIIITAVAVDISVPVLTVITEHFGVSSDRSLFIISSFLAGYGLSMIPVGLLSDRYGRIPVMYIGLAVYILGGVFTVYAPSFEILLWGRFFQGIGGGVGPVNARAIARDLASGKDLAVLMSTITMGLFFAPIISPILGSQLNEYFGWQAALWVAPLLGVICIVSVWKNAYRTASVPNNPTSFFRQITRSMQLFFASKQSLWALLIIMVSFAGFQIILASSSLLMVDIYGIETNKVGIIFGSTATLMVLAIYYNKRKSATVSPEKLLKYGIILTILAALGLIGCYVLGAVPFWLVWAFIAIYITANGFILPNTSTLALDPLSNIAGFAASIFGAGMILSSSLAIMVAAMVYNGTLISITAGIIICSVLTCLIFFSGSYFRNK